MDDDIFKVLRIRNQVNIFCQYSKSAIKLEKNGRGSASDKSRHIDIRYFFNKDIFQREQLIVKDYQIEK